MVAARLLEVSGCGLMENRFDLFRSCFALPTRIETFEASREITTEAALRRLFDDVRQYHASLGVTDLDRRLLEAERSGPDRISYTHETRMLNNAHLVQDTYPVFSVAVLQDGQWKLVRSSYAIVDQPKYVEVLTGWRP